MFAGLPNNFALLTMLRLIGKAKAELLEQYYNITILFQEAKIKIVQSD